MKDINSTWFECKVRHAVLTADGAQKRATVAYVVDALSWAEAEARISAKMHDFGEFEITSIKKCNFKEVVINDGLADGYWFKVKLQFITIDEKTEKEKRNNVYYLVNAASIDDAKSTIDEVMGSTMIDYVVASISDTPYMDVFEHNN